MRCIRVTAVLLQRRLREPQHMQALIIFSVLQECLPRTYNYAYSNASSTFTCHNANYLITFCPSTTRLQFGTCKIIFDALGLVDCYIFQSFPTTTNRLLQLIDCYVLTVNLKHKMPIDCVQYLCHDKIGWSPTVLSSSLRHAFFT